MWLVPVTCWIFFCCFCKMVLLCVALFPMRLIHVESHKRSIDKNSIVTSSVSDKLSGTYAIEFLSTTDCTGSAQSVFPIWLRWRLVFYSLSSFWHLTCCIRCIIDFTWTFLINKTNAYIFQFISTCYQISQLYPSPFTRKKNRIHYNLCDIVSTWAIIVTWFTIICFAIQPSSECTCAIH